MGLVEGLARVFARDCTGFGVACNTRAGFGRKVSASIRLSGILYCLCLYMVVCAFGLVCLVWPIGCRRIIPSGFELKSLKGFKVTGHGLRVQAYYNNSVDSKKSSSSLSSSSSTHS